MTEPSDPLLRADEIRALLVELGQRLDARGIEARLFLVGGAAMALAFGRERATRDLDAVFEPKQEIYREAALMARDRGLADDWLNEGFTALLPDRQPPTEGSASFTTTGLHVGVASAEYLFAMKAQAARQETDGADLVVLARILGIESAEQGLTLVERYYDPRQLSVKTQFLLEDILTRGLDAAGALSSRRARRRFRGARSGRPG